MKRSGTICRTAAVAALYASLCFVNPFSFGPLQFRIANMLVGLPLIKRQYVASILVGIALANAASPLGPIDVLFGVAAEGVGYGLCVFGPLKTAPFAIRAFAVSSAVSLIVGIELWTVYLAPYWLTVFGLFLTTSAAVYTGALIVERSVLKKIL